MNTHRHLSAEEICERISEGLPQEGIAGCEACETEARSVSRLLGDLRLGDAEAGRTTEWDDLLLRSRIREAIAREKPHSRSLFDRFAVLRPALVSLALTGLVFAVWTPSSRFWDAGPTALGSAPAVPRGGGHIPSWTALPDESEDEGLAVLSEWNPSEAELAIARCRSACLGGLSPEEEENLLQFLGSDAGPDLFTGATPL